MFGWWRRLEVFWRVNVSESNPRFSRPVRLYRPIHFLFARIELIFGHSGLYGVKKRFPVEDDDILRFDGFLVLILVRPSFPARLHLLRKN